MRDFTIRTEDQISMMLQSFRKARGLSQKELADRLGISQQNLSDLERNVAKASAGRLFRLLAALEIELVFRDALATDTTSIDDSEPRW
jgi:HTH-type transcriptional regulator / antitoxin HipB